MRVHFFYLDVLYQFHYLKLGCFEAVNTTVLVEHSHKLPVLYTFKLHLWQFNCLFAKFCLHVRNRLLLSYIMRSERSVLLVV